MSGKQWLLFDMTQSPIAQSNTQIEVGQPRQVHSEVDLNLANLLG